MKSWSLCVHHQGVRGYILTLHDQSIQRMTNKLLVIFWHWQEGPFFGGPFCGWNKQYLYFRSWIEQNNTLVLSLIVCWWNVKRVMQLKVGDVNGLGRGSLYALQIWWIVSTEAQDNYLQSSSLLICQCWCMWGKPSSVFIIIFIRKAFWD